MSGSSPRVALVHDWLTGMRGGEKVLEEIAALYPEAPIFTLFHFPGSVSETLESHPIHASYMNRAPWRHKHYRAYLPLFPRAIERFDLSDFDLVLSTSHCVAKGVKTRPDALHVCYCHTPMRYAWDQEEAYFPKRTGAVALVRGRMLERLRRWDVATASRVDRFLANSNFVAGRIRRYYDRDSEVLHPPVDTEFFTPPETEGKRENWALMVSALAPYKRVDLAIEACRAAGVGLRVVGDGPERERLSRIADAGNDVELLGRVDGAELRDLYRKALCFVQPGVEDFGIAAVESLSCACPVVALRAGGVRDIVEDGVHGVLYEGEGDAAAMTAAIDKIVELRFNPLNLRERAEGFSKVRFTSRFKAFLEVSAVD